MSTAALHDHHPGDDATLHDCFTAMWLDERERYGTSRRKARKWAWAQLTKRPLKNAAPSPGQERAK